LDGLALALREKGLQRVQIADIVAHARTSRRTFYECFADKESAVIELIRESSIGLHALVESAIDREEGWETQIDRAIDTYVAALSGDAKLAASLSRELPALGRRGAELQHEGIERFARLLVSITAGSAMRDAGVRRVSFDEAVMLMGGVAELMARAMDEDRALATVGVTAKELIKAAIEPRRS